VRPGRVLRGGKGKRHNWRPVAIYSGLVILAGIALALWDHAYEARRAAVFQPPPPPVLAKNLVEGLVGSGTVQNVAFDGKAGTLEMSIKDVLLKSGQTLAEKKKNLTAEGTLTIQILQSQMPRLTGITVHVVADGTTVATAQTKPGQTVPAVEFSPDLK
jgi:hypothetical protein